MPFQKDDDSPPGYTDPSSALLPSPGRDSSRLMQDLLEHDFADPRIQSPPPHFDPTKPHSSPEPSHTHSWIMNNRESTKSRPWNALYEDQSIAAICETCRIHMSLTATITADDLSKCGSHESPFKSHHFHLESWTCSTRASSNSTTIESKRESGAFQCCQCPFALQIDFMVPVVPEYLLSSLKKRKTGQNSSLPLIGRSNDSKLFIAKAFATLSTYCRDVLNRGVDERKDINLTPEGPFARKIGLDLDVIRFMEYLGWCRDNNGTMLKPPQWDESLHKGRLLRKLLEGAEMELARLALESAKDLEKGDLRPFTSNLTSAEAEIARLMSAPWPRPGFNNRFENYFRKSINLDEPVNPSFACLGIVQDVDDTTIINAYETQVQDDPPNTVFYLECLQDIGSSMQNRKINQFADGQAAHGVYTRFDLQKAYRTLEIDHPDGIDDDGLIAVFHSRCADMMRRESDFRHALDVIQHFRRQWGINNKSKTAERREMDTTEAFHRLRITDFSIRDDGIIASFVSCTVDYPNERDLLVEALKVLGKDRNSLAIRSFLSEQNESTVAIGPLNRQMSLDEAYIVLGVEGGAKHDDGAIMIAYNELVVVQPERTEEFKKAVNVIADDRDSIPLKTFLIDMNSTPDNQKPPPGSETHPVGLENIAQTCYMNSLFQYYFTVKPLREAILNYEPHEEGDLTEEELKKKQISKWELQRSKRFIAQLRLLFQQLITSDLAYIRPKEELVRLTLVDVKQEIEDEAIKRRQSLATNASTSILDSEIPELVEIEDTAVLRAPVSSPMAMATSGEPVPEITSPLGKTALEIANIQISSAQDDTDYEFIDHESNDSGGVVSLTTSDPTSTDKENNPQSLIINKSRHEKSPLGESQQVNVMTTEIQNPDDEEDIEMMDFGNAPPTPPKSPPPIPKRPRRKSTWGALKYGSQQDVTECITNCLSQFHAGFKQELLDSNGNAIDIFKRLFYIRVKHVFRDLHGPPTAKPVDEREELYGSMVPIYVDAEIGGSLYDAIDLALGREKIEYQGIGECEKITTVTSLPPILQIQIVRAQFNRSVGAGYKENAHLELESKIYMDRYMESADGDLSTRRDDYWKWKVELDFAQRKKAELLRKSELPMNPLEMLAMARGFLEKLANTGPMDERVPSELVDGLALYEKDLRNQVEKLDKDIDNLKSRIKQQFTDRRNYGYRLHSVFIHRGDVAYGHYWIYIYDFAQNRWFKYNDEQVTEVDEKDVYADNSAEGAGPYFVTYVKEDEANNLVEAVKRDLSGNLIGLAD